MGLFLKSMKTLQRMENTVIMLLGISIKRNQLLYVNLALTKLLALRYNLSFNDYYDKDKFDWLNLILCCLIIPINYTIKMEST